MTTIILSHNHLDGSIPKSFSFSFLCCRNCEHLHCVLSVENNLLNGSFSTDIWQNKFTSTSTLLIDLRNNSLSTFRVLLETSECYSKVKGNPVCNNVNVRNIIKYCGSEAGAEHKMNNSVNVTGDLFGPYELLNFTLMGPYSYLNPDIQAKHKSKGASAAVIAACAFAAFASTIIAVLIKRRHAKYQESSRKRLSDKTIVAIKRAKEGSVQGQKEFLTEISLLSRLHHRNLVSLLGYCDEEGEQMVCTMCNGNFAKLDFCFNNWRSNVKKLTDLITIIVKRTLKLEQIADRTGAAAASLPPYRSSSTYIP
ncbi:hypothetical protein HAX54_023106 [Datura stramonium]|uniref:Serine-threonine/tyrosine-protein kinase catalytic domain-containing protein n=1 Tax=Datura stramonium TaxID=4076 RepID=A0ABS8RJV8_DATST|nr:hypothetical protein [Datura stramonium]